LKIALAGMGHESNTFNKTKTGWADDYKSLKELASQLAKNF